MAKECKRGGYDIGCWVLTGVHSCILWDVLHLCQLSQQFQCLSCQLEPLISAPPQWHSRNSVIQTIKLQGPTSLEGHWGYTEVGTSVPPMSYAASHNTCGVGPALWETIHFTSSWPNDQPVMPALLRSQQTCLLNERVPRTRQSVWWVEVAGQKNAESDCSSESTDKWFRMVKFYPQKEISKRSPTVFTVPSDIPTMPFFSHVFWCFLMFSACCSVPRDCGWGYPCKVGTGPGPPGPGPQALAKMDCWNLLNVWRLKGRLF